jgi:hypothetical protein
MTPFGYFGRHIGRVLSVAVVGGGVMAGGAIGIGSPNAVAAPAHPAAAPVCSDSWKKAASGKWSVATNWSTGVVPTSSANVCIKVAGTYTVTLTGTESANTLTLGGSSGTQTVDVQGNTSSSGLFTLTSNGSTIATHGVLALDSQSATGAGYAQIDSSGTNVSLKNSGTFETLGATVQADYIGVNLTNDGTVSIAGASTQENTDVAIVNNDTFTVASTGSLSESDQGTGTSFDQMAGTLVNSGSLVLSGAKFTQSGGTESGNPVQLTQFSTLVDSAGTGAFTATGNDSLRGTIPVGQSLTVIGGSTSGILTLLGNVTNDGSLTLQVGSGGSAAELSSDSVAGRMLKNYGDFSTSGAAGDDVDISSDLTNEKGGTVTLGAVTTNEEPSFNITNDGKFAVPVKETLDVIGGSESTTTFTQGKGTLANNGTILLNSADFAASGGTESGHPVQLTDFSGLIDSAGSGSYTLLGQSGLSGTIPTGQTVTVRGDSTDGVANADLASDVTNDGTFILDSTSAADTAGFTNDSNFNLTNNGTFDANGATGGSDLINAPFSNTGSVTINALTVGEAYQTIANNGTFTITPNNEFETTGGSEAATDFNNDGSLDNEGSFILDNTTINLNSSGTYEATFGAPKDTPSTLSGVPGNSGDIGTVNLGGTLEITTVGTPAVGTQYAVVGGSTAVTDTMGTFATTIFGTQHYTLSYTSNGVTATAS